MGLPSTLLERARELLGGQHLELDRWLKRLEEQEQQLHQERLDLIREQRRVEALGEQRQQEMEQLEEERQRQVARLEGERERLRRVARARLDEALALLDEATRDQRPLGRRQRQRLRDDTLALPEVAPPPPSSEPPELATGVSVRLQRVGEGVVSEVRGDHALVAVAGKRVWVSTAELERAPAPASAHAAAVEVDADDQVPHEVRLLGMDADTARDELERFLDRALASSRSRVRVVHGHGTGALRRVVREVCSTHPAVRSFRHPPQHMGGTGVTEVALEGSDDGGA
jgi:DNA mismatch repair protein MutS2